MSFCKDALVAWRHHADEVEEVHDVDEVESMAFHAGWDAAGGDGRLAAIDRLQELVGECCCTMPEPGESLCHACLTLNTIRKLLGDEVDET